MPEYSTNLNIEKALGTENVNRAYFMRVIDDIDEKVGVANGLAKLDANGNVLKADGSLAGEVTKAQFDLHTNKPATTLQVGHVQLSDAVTSIDVTKAATSNAVKKAYDRADAAFTSASNGKAAVKQAVAGVDPRVVIPADPTFAQLATAVGQIETGARWAKGNASGGGDSITVSGLNFKPRLIFIGLVGAETSALSHTFWSFDLDPTRVYLGGSNQSYLLSSLGNYVNIGGFRLKRASLLSNPAFWIAYE